MIDAYAILRLPFSASEQDIQARFQEMMKTEPDSELLVQAYGMIRNRSGREAYRWSQINHCLLDPVAPSNAFDLATVIRELAFLSPWEMGDDSCLN